VITTASNGVVVVKKYSGEACCEAVSYGSFGDDAGVAGVTDPILTDSVDFERELADREKTHEPLPPVDTDLTNDDFGI